MDSSCLKTLLCGWIETIPVLSCQFLFGKWCRRWRWCRLFVYSPCVGVSVQPVVDVDTPVLELLHHINILSQERHGPFSRPFPSKVDHHEPLNFSSFEAGDSFKVHAAKSDKTSVFLPLSFMYISNQCRIKSISVGRTIWSCTLVRGVQGFFKCKICNFFTKMHP